MEVSLFHRLSGAWFGAIALEDDSSICMAQDEAKEKFLGFLNGEPTKSSKIESHKDSLHSALALLPVMLFYHEDPQYMDARLQDFNLPAEHKPLISDLAQWVSGALRERWTVNNLKSWIIEHRIQTEPLASRFLLECHDRHDSWRKYRQTLSSLPISSAMKKILLVYGALLYGNLHVSRCLPLLKNELPIVLCWEMILLGCVRGDRHLSTNSLNTKQSLQIYTLQQDVLAFWSRWLGLPTGNKLQLDQIPVMANCQVIQSRSNLNLVSQNHLT